MAAKFFLVFCASALLIAVKAISGQCIGNGYNVGLLNNGCGNGLALGSRLGLSGLGYSINGCGSGLGNLAGLAAPSSGGALAISSASPVYPSGLSVASESAISGTVGVSGVLPFVSVVALEGQMPSVGAAGVQYSCGSGVGVEAVAGRGCGAGLAGAGRGCGAGLAEAGLGFGAGLAGAGLGYGFGGSLGACGCGLY